MVRIIGRLLESAIEPKAVLLSFSVLHFLSVPSHFEGLCLYNWSWHWWQAFIVVVAALALRMGRCWTYLAAIYLTGQALFRGLYVMLGLNPELSPQEWWAFFVTDPVLYRPAALNILVFGYASVCLLARLRRRHKLR